MTVLSGFIVSIAVIQSSDVAGSVSVAVCLGDGGEAVLGRTSRLVDVGQRRVDHVVGVLVQGSQSREHPSSLCRHHHPHHHGKQTSIGSEYNSYNSELYISI